MQQELQQSSKNLRKDLKNGIKISLRNKLIKESNDVLAVLDKLEENRPLFIQEFNFRTTLKNHIMQLLR